MPLLQREVAIRKEEIEALQAQLKLKTQQLETVSTRLNQLSEV